jgi:hypothetical protein
MLIINFDEIKNQIKNLSLKNIFSRMFTILSIIFFDKNYIIYNFDKNIFNLTESPIENKIPILNNPSKYKSFKDFENAFTNNYQQEFDYFDSFFTNENFFKLFLITINILPIILNSIWGELISFESRSHFLLKNLIPNPVFISLLTILLEYFFIDTIRGHGIFSLYGLVNFSCYLIFISFLIYEFFITKNFSYWAIFYFIVIVFNFVGIYFYNSSITKNITFNEEANKLPNNIEDNKSNLYNLYFLKTSLNKSIINFYR